MEADLKMLISDLAGKGATPPAIVVNTAAALSFMPDGAVDCTTLWIIGYHSLPRIWAVYGPRATERDAVDIPVRGRSNRPVQLDCWPRRANTSGRPTFAIRL
jgi:hypothetical protein